MGNVNMVKKRTIGVTLLGVLFIIIGIIYSLNSGDFYKQYEKHIEVIRKSSKSLIHELDESYVLVFSGEDNYLENLKKSGSVELYKSEFERYRVELVHLTNNYQTFHRRSIPFTTFLVIMLDILFLGLRKISKT